MPPPPEGCDISSVVIKQDTPGNPNAKTTLTVSRSRPLSVEVTSEFGNSFPPVPVTVKIVIIDNSIGGAIGVFFANNVFFGPADTSNVTAFAVGKLMSLVPAVSSGDVCTIYATLVPTTNPPVVPDASFMILNFMVIP